MTQNEQSTGAKRPFKQTRALIRLALNDGLTQKEIAALCRTQQSIVSAWAKGTKLANEGQLTELLTRYGHTLRRQSFRLYWSIDDETIVHHQGEDSFRIVSQARIQFNNGLLLDSYQDDSIWFSSISPPLTGKQLVRHLDKVGTEIASKWPSDGHALPFLIRQALLQHGFPVEGIEEYPSQW